MEYIVEKTKRVGDTQTKRLGCGESGGLILRILDLLAPGYPDRPLLEHADRAAQILGIEKHAHRRNVLLWGLVLLRTPIPDTPHFAEVARSPIVAQRPRQG